MTKSYAKLNIFSLKKQRKNIYFLFHFYSIPKLAVQPSAWGQSKAVKTESAGVSMKSQSGRILLPYVLIYELIAFISEY